MICHQGRVLSVAQDSALIVVDPEHACQACSSGKGCGMSVFSRWLGSRVVSLKVETTGSWTPGQAVSLKVAPELLLRMAAWAYGVPLLGFVAGAGIATWSVQDSLSGAGTDLIALMCGVGGLLIGGLGVRRWAAPLALSAGSGRDILIE
jgi:positive regulator of sigma E activity